MIARALACAAALALAACGGVPSADDGGTDVSPAVDASGDGATPTVGALAVTRVAWNGPDAAVGTAAAVAQSGGLTYVFGTTGATVIAGAAVQANDPSVTQWASAAVVPAADTAHDTWAVGIDAMGKVYHLRDGDALEDVSDRYGLAGVHVRAAVANGTVAAFASDTIVALADGTEVQTYAMAFTSLAAGGNRVAGVTAAGAVMIEDGMSGAWSQYAMAGAALVALDANGALYVSSDHAILAAAPGGALEIVYQNTDAAIHGLAGSGTRVWFAVGGELGAIDTGTGAVAATTGLGLASGATLTGSPSGDVWVFAGGALLRFTASMGAQTVEQQWQTAVGPVFARNCGACHTGSAGEGHHDLSTYTAWHGDRALIYNRVFLHMPDTMPPTGTVTTADQAVIRAWSAPDAGM